MWSKLHLIRSIDTFWLFSLHQHELSCSMSLDTIKIRKRTWMLLNSLDPTRFRILSKTEAFKWGSYLFGVVDFLFLRGSSCLPLPKPTFLGQVQLCLGTRTTDQLGQRGRLTNSATGCDNHTFAFGVHFGWRPIRVPKTQLLPKQFDPALFSLLLG